MDPGRTFGLLVGAGLTVFGVTHWRRIWSGEVLELSDASTRDWFPAGEALRRGFVRATPVGLVAVVALFTCVASFTLVDALDGSAASALDRLSQAAALVALAAMLVDACVVLVNRPRWAVPPPYRGEPGALAMWWHGRRGNAA